MTCDTFATESFRKPVVMLLRHLAAIAILPFTVAVLIPVWIGRRYPVALFVGSAAGQIASRILGVAALAAGLLLFGASLRHFAVQGRGTLALWHVRRFIS